LVEKNLLAAFRKGRACEGATKPTAEPEKESEQFFIPALAPKGPRPEKSPQRIEFEYGLRFTVHPVPTPISTKDEESNNNGEGGNNRCR